MLPFGASAAAQAYAGPKFSVMLWTLPKGLTFEQQIQMVADAGFTGAEVGNEYEKWTPEEWKRNVAKLHATGITIDSAVPGRNALSDHTKRDKLKADLLAAMPRLKDLGCKQFIYTAYTRVEGQTHDQMVAAVADSLKFAADIVAKDDIEIVLEPIDLLEYKLESVPSVTDAFEITRLVNNPKVKVLYDIYHEQKQAGNIIEKFTKNIDQVGLVHIADVPGRHQPGTGELNYTNIYRELARLKYDRVICMEFMSQGDVVSTLRKAREEAVAAMKSV